MSLGSSRPYLVRALYDWIVDGNEDPYVVVDCFFPGVQVPDSDIKDGQIILNLSPRAVTQFKMSDFGVTFQARFGGIPTGIVLPYGAITAIYGRESGLGMAFGQEPGGIPRRPGEDNNTSLAVVPPETKNEEFSEEQSTPRKGKPNLRIVKSDD